jgi:membrane protease YdiL (CAAX protease family)
VTLQQYLATSRQVRYSVLFAVPLLLLYEGLSAMLSGSAVAGVRNGADVLLKTVFISLGGRWGLLVFGLIFLGVGGWLVWRDHKRQGTPMVPRVFLAMFAESLVYAALFGQTVALLTTWLLQGGPSILAVAQSQSPVAALPFGTQLVVSLGAGLYEELLFRVLLVSALLLIGIRLGWKRPVAVAVAVVLSALIFSGFHYIGPYGDQFTTPSFTFRAIAGLLLSGLYVARGFGIAAWTHALYDVGLAVLTGT